MNARFFWIALGLISISWIANSIYAYSKQLDEPIFLDHYIETQLQDTVHMTFYYLTNKNDMATVTSVSAGEWFGHPRTHYFSSEQVQNEQIFNNHVLRRIDVMFDTVQLDSSIHPENHSFTGLDVYFSDGKRITTPIGIVHVHPFSNEESPLKQPSSMSGSYYNLAHYYATEPLTVESITNPFQEDMQNNFLIKVHTPNDPPANKGFNNSTQNEWNALPALDLKDINFPFNMKKDERLNVYSTIVPDFKAVLELQIPISGTTASGKPFSTTAGYFHYPYLEQEDVNEIIKRKAKEGSDE